MEVAIDTNTFTSNLKQLIKRRNQIETEPYISIHTSNSNLRNQVDALQYRCHALEKELNDQYELHRNYDEQSEASTGGTGGPTKTEIRQRDKIEKLQEQLNEKLRDEIETSAKALQSATELSTLQQTTHAQESEISSLRQSNESQQKTIESLNSQVGEFEVRVRLAEKQYEGLKKTIRELQGENDELNRQNRVLVERVVKEKEKASEEINKMNEMVDGYKKEVEMLRELGKQEEKRKKGWFGLGGGGGWDGDDDKLKGEEGEEKEKKSERRWGLCGVIVPTGPKTTLRVHPSEATAVRYDGTGGDLVATASVDSTVKVWDTANGQLKATLRGGSGHSMQGVDIGGGLVVGCGSDKTCRVWNLNTQRMIHQLAGHSNKITCVRLHNTQKSVLTGSADRSIKLWDITRSTYKQTFTFRYGSTSNSLDVSDSVAVSGHLDGSLRFWDLRSGERTGDMSEVHLGGVTSVSFCQGGASVVTVGRDSYVRVVDMRNGMVVGSMRDDGFRATLNYSSGAVSPDGLHVAAASSTTGEVFVWRIDDGKLEKKLKGHKAGACGVAWGRGGSNGQQVASVDRDGMMVLWA